MYTRLVTRHVPWSLHFGHTPCSFSDENKFLQQRRLSEKRPNTFQKTQMWSTLCKQHVYVSWPCFALITIYQRHIKLGEIFYSCDSLLLDVLTMYPKFHEDWITLPFLSQGEEIQSQCSDCMRHLQWPGYWSEERHVHCLCKLAEVQRLWRDRDMNQTHNYSSQTTPLENTMSGVGCTQGE